MRAALLMIGLVGALLGACRSDRRAAERDVADDTLRVGEHALLSDAQVFHTVIAVTEIGAATAGRALEQSQHVDVEVFAQVLHADHTALQRAFADLAAQLGIQPEPNEISQQLQAQSNQLLARIEASEGLEFDRSFVQGGLEFYQAFVEALDNRLLPSARDEHLRETLRAAKPTFEAHLQRAAQLRVELEDVQPEPPVESPPPRPAEQQPPRPPAPPPPPDTIPRDTIVRGS